MTYRLMTGLALAAIVLIGGAIYSLSKVSEATWSPSPLKIPNIQPSPDRKNLPQFEYSDQGLRLKTEDFLEKWTLLSFWAYYCPPCLHELPSLNQMTLQWQGPELNVVTVNLDPPNSENYELARKYVLDSEIVLPTFFDKESKLKMAFQVDALPHHFLIDPTGKIIWEAQGAFSWSDIKTRDQLVKLMELQSPDSEPVPEE